MANNGSQRPLGHINSILFTKLPAEVRSMIYCEAFIGSKVEIGRKNSWVDHKNRNTDDGRIYVLPSKHHRLLRTSKEVYYESRRIYWTETTVTCAHCPLQKNLSTIPVYARPYIRVLEGVVPADNFSPHNRLPLGQFLGHFTGLQYCQLLHQSVYIFCLHDAASSQDLLEAAGSDAFRAVACTLNSNNPPVLVQRAYVHSRICTQRVDWTYINHTSGRIFTTARGSISDEEGFREVTKSVEGLDGVDDPHNTDDTQKPHDAQKPHEAQRTDEVQGKDKIGKADETGAYDLLDTHELREAGEAGEMDKPDDVNDEEK